jgi:hypothetical protein
MALSQVENASFVSLQGSHLAREWTNSLLPPPRWVLNGGEAHGLQGTW